MRNKTGSVFLTLCIGVGIGIFAFPRPVAAAEEHSSDRPNFLIILADDMGFSDAGAYGGEIDTPNLDRLAANGLRYTQMYSTGRCWPSRASLLTGYYAPQVRMDPPRGNIGSLPEWGPLLPEHFKPLNYRMYHSGKWHIQLEPPLRPLR